MSFDLKENEKLSPWWRITTFIVILIGFSILGFVTSLAYDNLPPIPKRVVDPSGQTLFTAEQITGGQTVFLKKQLNGAWHSMGAWSLSWPRL